jgi:hypothetical protein
MGYAHPKAILAIKNDLLKDRKSSFRPSPAIHQQIGFGLGRSKQSMAKACIVLWAKEVGNDELQDSRYEKMRAFILSDVDGESVKDIMQIDTRPLSALPDKFGDNPNVIWIASNELGQVYGYYRLYGAIGWRFLICESGAPPSTQICLISNPFDNSKWSCLRGNDVPICQEYLWAEWEPWPPQFEAVKAKLNVMMSYAKNLSRELWVADLANAAFEKTGLQEGEIIKEEHIKIISDHISSALLPLILKKNIPDK